MKLNKKQKVWFKLFISHKKLIDKLLSNSQSKDWVEIYQIEQSFDAIIFEILGSNALQYLDERRYDDYDDIE